MRILGIAGSVRRGSHNRRLIRAAGDSLPSGVELVEWEGLGGLPIFDEDLENDPPAVVQDFLDAVESADALLISTPEYNASLPGGLKNALDWASRPVATNAFRNKPVAVIGSSAGAFGGVWAAAELRKVLAAMGARVAEAELAVGHAHEKFGDDGLLADDDVREGLREALGTLLSEVAPELSATV
jgi:chromate reductase, NAD(P)H dehydrogenase (quinone)